MGRLHQHRPLPRPLCALFPHIALKPREDSPWSRPLQGGVWYRRDITRARVRAYRRISLRARHAQLAGVYIRAGTRERHGLVPGEDAGEPDRGARGAVVSEDDARTACQVRVFLFFWSDVVFVYA